MGGVGGWGMRNLPAAIPYAEILLLTLNITPTKFHPNLIWGGIGMGREWVKRGLDTLCSFLGVTHQK